MWLAVVKHYSMTSIWFPVSERNTHTHTFHTHTYVCTIKADLPTCILLYSPRRHFLFPTMPFLCPTTTTTTTRKPYHWSLCLPSAPLCPAVQPWGVNPNSIKHLLKEDHARLVRDRSQRKYALKLNVFTHMHTHIQLFQHFSIPLTLEQPRYPIIYTFSRCKRLNDSRHIGVDLFCLTCPVSFPLIHCLCDVMVWK